MWGNAWGKTKKYGKATGYFAFDFVVQSIKSTGQLFQLIIPTTIFSAFSMVLNFNGMGSRVLASNQANCAENTFAPFAVPNPCGLDVGSGSNVTAGFNFLVQYVTSNVTREYEIFDPSTNESFTGTTFTYTDATLALGAGTVQSTLGLIAWTILLASSIAGFNALVYKTTGKSMLAYLLDSEWYRNIIENFNLQWSKNSRNKTALIALGVVNVFPIIWGLLFTYKQMNDTNNNAPSYAKTDCPSIDIQAQHQMLNPGQYYTDLCNSDTVMAVFSAATLGGLGFWNGVCVLLGACNNAIALAQTCVGARKKANKKISLELIDGDGETHTLAENIKVAVNDLDEADEERADLAIKHTMLQIQVMDPKTDKPLRMNLDISGVLKRIWDKRTNGAIEEQDGDLDLYVDPHSEYIEISPIKKPLLNGQNGHHGRSNENGYGTMPRVTA